MKDPIETGVVGRPRLWLRYLPLVLLLAAAAFVFGLGLHRHVSLESAIRHSAELGRIAAENPLTAYMSYVGVYCAAVALAMPGAVIFTMFGGFLFGWFFGALGGIIGATLGGTITVVIGSTSIGRSLELAVFPRFHKLAEGFRNGAFGYILLLRLIPVVPYIAINVAAALFRVPLRIFVPATAVGIAPIAFSFGFIGSGLDQGIEKQLAAYRACEAANEAACRIEFDPAHYMSPHLMGGVLLAAALVSLPLIFRKRIARFRRQPRKESAKL